MSLASTDFEDFEPSVNHCEQGVIAECPYVRGEKISLPSPVPAVVEGSVYAVLTGAVSCAGSTFAPGDFFLIPASLDRAVVEPMRPARFQNPTRARRPVLPAGRHVSFPGPSKALGYSPTGQARSVEFRASTARGVIERAYRIVSLEKSANNIWLSLTILGIGDRAAETISRLVRITSRECAPLEFYVRPAHLHIDVVSLPVFVTPVEDKPADADLIISSAHVGGDRIPKRCDEIGGRTWHAK